MRPRGLRRRWAGEQVDGTTWRFFVDFQATCRLTGHCRHPSSTQSKSPEVIGNTQPLLVGLVSCPNRNLQASETKSSLAAKCQEGKPCQPQKQGKFLRGGPPWIAARAAARRGSKPVPRLCPPCRSCPSRLNLRTADTAVARDESCGSGAGPTLKSGLVLQAPRYWKNTDRQKAAHSLTSSTQMPPARSTLCMRVNHSSWCQASPRPSQIRANSRRL